MNDIDVEALNRRLGCALMTDNGLAPVANWLDADGDECGFLDAAIAIVEYKGEWFCVELQDFEPTPSH